MYQPEKPCRSNPKTKTPIFWSQVTTHQSLAANIGTPSAGVDENKSRIPGVARSSQPRAGGRNPFGIRGTSRTKSLSDSKELLKIPTGFRPPAQGCPECLRSNLGATVEAPQPQRGCVPCRTDCVSYLWEVIPRFEFRGINSFS